MGSLFKSAAPAPVIKPPAIMPTPDDAAIMAAKRRKAAELMSRSGRASTMLSDYSSAGASDKLG